MTAVSGASFPSFGLVPGAYGVQQSAEAPSRTKEELLKRLAENKGHVYWEYLYEWSYATTAELLTLTPDEADSAGHDVLYNALHNADTLDLRPSVNDKPTFLEFCALVDKGHTSSELGSGDSAKLIFAIDTDNIVEARNILSRVKIQDLSFPKRGPYIDPIRLAMGMELYDIALTLAQGGLETDWPLNALKVFDAFDKPNLEIVILENGEGLTPKSVRDDISFLKKVVCSKYGTKKAVQYLVEKRGFKESLHLCQFASDNPLTHLLNSEREDNEKSEIGVYLIEQGCLTYRHEFDGLRRSLSAPVYEKLWAALPLMRKSSETIYAVGNAAFKALSSLPGVVRDTFQRLETAVLRTSVSDHSASQEFHEPDERIEPEERERKERKIEEV